MKKLVLLIVLAILIASSAHAAITVTTLMSPTINNGSFEGSVANDYWSAVGNPPGWTYSGISPWNYDAGHGVQEGLLATSMDGSFSYTDTKPVMNLLPSYTITADTTYEMSLYVQKSAGQWIYPALKAVNGSIKTSITPFLEVTVNSSGDDWQKVTLNSGAVSAGLVGQQLEVSCYSWNPWATIDNVVVTATTTTPDAVPEPSSLIALMSGIVGISGLIIRKRK